MFDPYRKPQQVIRDPDFFPDLRWNITVGLPDRIGNQGLDSAQALCKYD